MKKCVRQCSRYSLKQGDSLANFVLENIYSKSNQIKFEILLLLLLLFIYFELHPKTDQLSGHS